MHELGADPHQRKALQRLFPPSEAAEMVGRTPSTKSRQQSPGRLYPSSSSSFPGTLWHTALAGSGDGLGAHYRLPEFQGRRG
jgi:hypothetical protein